jgi:hypothetical protein
MKTVDCEMIRITAASVGLIDSSVGGGHVFESCLHHTLSLVPISQNNASINHPINSLISNAYLQFQVVIKGISFVTSA